MKRCSQQMRGRQLSKKAAQGEGNDSGEDSSSEGKTDHLSYSYSCVKSFRRNQHIIADLAALYNKQGYQGINHEPALYSLSGLRDKPIYQPYYSRNVSENNSEDEYEHKMVPSWVEKGEQDHHLIKSESQTQFPVKQVLFQWLKHQFKQVNSLWTYAISKDIFISKFCKRSQKMKMEMTLNGVDEGTKNKLIDYINKLNLGFEEHCNICTGNETVIEIDVTSILDDSQRLKSFLTFLKSIDSEKSNVLNGMDNSKINNYANTDEVNLGKKALNQQKACHLAKSFRKTVPHQSQLSVKSESGERITMKPNPTALKLDNKYQREMRSIIPPKYEKAEEGINMKKVRQITTISKENGKQKFCDLPKTNFDKNNLLEPRKLKLEHNVYSVQTNMANDASKFVNGEFSCKCLIHNNREDFNRYKYQCLFGKGDELNNTFIKYINERKNISEQNQDFNENQRNDLVENTDKDGGFKKPYITVNSDRCVDKTCNLLQKDDKNIIFMKDGIVPNKSPLNDRVTLQNRRIDTFEDSSSKKYKDDKDIRVIARNACFKSVSHCMDPFPANDFSELNLGENKQCGNQFHFLNQSSCQYQGGSDILDKSYIKPAGNLCNMNTKWNKQITNKIVTNTYDHSSENKLYLFQKDPDLDVNSCIDESTFEKVENNKTNYFRNNERNSQHFDDSHYGINKKYVRDHERLQNTPNVVKMHNDLLSDIPTNEKDSILCSLMHKKSKCCIVGCDCENVKRKSKIRTIVFRIGPPAKEEPSSNTSTFKRSCKVKSLKQNKLSKKISSVFKGNRLEKSLSLILSSGIADKTIRYSTVVNKPCINKTDSSSSSWVNIEDYVSITDPLVSRSKGTTPTQNSVVTDASQIENSIGILISELQNQRMEIDYLKNVLHNKIT